MSQQKRNPNASWPHASRNTNRYRLPLTTRVLSLVFRANGLAHDISVMESKLKDAQKKLRVKEAQAANSLKERDDAVDALGNTDFLSSCPVYVLYKGAVLGLKVKYHSLLRSFASWLAPLPPPPFPNQSHCQTKTVPVFSRTKIQVQGPAAGIGLQQVPTGRRDRAPGGV